jgi:hypothetical protein
MKLVRTTAAILLAALATTSCGSSGGAPTDLAAPTAVVGPLPDGVVARVGPSAIHSESVGRIAALQRVDVRAARDLAVRDALFARDAEARGLDVAADVRGVLARRLLRSIRADVERIPLAPTELTEAAEGREQHSHIPRSIVSPELLEADIYDMRSREAVGEILTAKQAQSERAKDADALLALVRIDQ